MMNCCRHNGEDACMLMVEYDKMAYFCQWHKHFFWTGLMYSLKKFSIYSSLVFVIHFILQWQNGFYSPIIFNHVILNEIKTTLWNNYNSKSSNYFHFFFQFLKLIQLNHQYVSKCQSGKMINFNYLSCWVYQFILIFDYFICENISMVESEKLINKNKT